MNEQAQPKTKPLSNLAYLAKSSVASSRCVAAAPAPLPSPSPGHNAASPEMAPDLFGAINEEQPTLHDELAHESLWPWELQRQVKYAYVQSEGEGEEELPLLLHGSSAPGSGSGSGSGSGHNSGPNSLASCLNSLQSRLNSLDCWDYTIELECLKGPQDLQLAAELGKTLLERNKELEILLKEHKTNSEEQEREIVHLRKQINAMSEVNDSRLKVYEQLEVGIQDLERTNHRLNVEKTRDKKQIKSLTSNVEALETRCEELNKQLEDTRQTLSTERRKNERLVQERSADADVRLRPSTGKQQTPNGNDHELAGLDDSRELAAENCSFAFEQRNKANSTGLNESSLPNDNSMLLSLAGAFSDVHAPAGEDNEELIKLISDLESTKRAFIAEQRRCGELEEQLVVIIQENQTLQGRIAQTSSNEEMMSMHDEFSLLDDVRQGQMCSRCLRAVDDRVTNNDELSSVAPTEEADEEDERSLLGLESQRDGDQGSELSSQAGGYGAMKLGLHAPESLELPASPNPYRDLVEKYEALLEVQRSSITRKNTSGTECAAAGLSLAEEFQNSGCKASTVPEAAAAAAVGAATTTAGNDSTKAEAKGGRGRTPTEFSEAETSSSGFLDETSNKYTQTDERPGYFLCSIGDGEDCKFSIYDDVSPIDSHFRDRPEYRELFKEIFAVLKKAAENKEEGEKLPLLDDEAQPQPELAATVAKVPPVTPANEELPVDFGDDAQSIVSSIVSEQSIAMSECITKLERKTVKKYMIESRNQENKPPAAVVAASIAQLSGACASPGPHSTPSSASHLAGAKQIIENGRVLTPFKREPLEYLTVGVGIKKKNRRKNRGLFNGGERVESPLALPSPPRVYVVSGSRRARRDFLPMPGGLAMPETGTTVVRARHMTTSAAGASSDWNGSPMFIYNRNANGARGARNRQFELNGVEYRPNTVSQELHKLKKLDLSYAEVLRRADACEHQHQQQRVQRQSRRRNAGNNVNNSHQQHH